MIHNLMPSREEQIEEIKAWNKIYEVVDRTNILNKVTSYANALKKESSGYASAKTVMHYSEYIRTKLISYIRNIKSAAETSIRSIKKNFAFPSYMMKSILEEISYFEHGINKLKFTLKKLKQKKFYVKEFNFLRKLIGTLNQYYKAMLSIVDELTLYVDRDISADYEDVVELIEALNNVSADVFGICYVAINDEYYKLPTAITQQDIAASATNYLYHGINGLIQQVAGFVEEIAFDIAGFSSRRIYEKQYNADFEFERYLNTTNGDKIFPYFVSRQLQKALEEMTAMRDHLMKIKPPFDTMKKIWVELSKSNEDANFVNACCDALDKFPRLIELAFGGLKQIVDHIFKSSVEDEKDYRDLVPAMNKRFRQAID